jgi:micrococcal nuclease
MYIYNAHVLSVYDGDTITVDIDLGFRIAVKKLKVRLYGLNAPEIKGVSKPQGQVSRDALRSRILDQDIVLHTIKDEQEKYGRWLGIIYLKDENINKWLLVNNYATPFMEDLDIVS